MKKIIFLICFLFSHSLHIYCQSDSILRQKNIIKVNISSLMLKSASVQYERLFSPRVSAAANIIYRPSQIFSPAFVEGDWNFSNEHLSVFAFTPSVRYYFGKKPNNGFYGELYGRYRRDNLTSQTTTAAFHDGIFYQSGTENMYITGIMLGCQLYTYQNIAIDFWIVGVGIGKTNFTSVSEYQRTAPPHVFQYPVQPTYETILHSTFGEGGTITWEGDQATYAASKLFIPPRGLGINVGIRF